MTYVATAIGADGKRQELVREASDEAALAAALRAGGLLVVSVARQAEPRSKRGDAEPPFVWRPMSALDVEMGLRQIAAMLRSGMPLLAALETVAEQSSGARARRVWNRVAASVTRGEPFAAALAASSRRFDDVTVRLADVGEKSGELELTLTRAAEQLNSRRNLRNTVANAFVYPCITVATAIAVSAYLVVAVIPKLADFLRSSGTALPALTQALVGLSEWIVANGAYVVVCVAGVTALWFSARFFSRTRELQDAMLLRVPVVGRVLRLSGTALFSRAMQIMLESGVTLTSALGTAAQLLTNRRLRRRVGAARDAVLAGRPLSKALADAPEFLPMLHRMAAVGETTGALPDTFGETARFHETILALTVKRLGILVEPVMIAVTGAIVGFVYVAFFMALFSIAGAA